VISFVVQLLDWIRYDQRHAFVLFCIYVWVVWLVKVLGARRYAKAERDYATTVSVVVPVFMEDPEVFERVLASIVHNRPDELLVVVDGGDDEMAALARRWTDRVWQIPKAGKRAALALAIPETRGEVVFIVDSDTIFTGDTIRNAVKPFADPTVGGVTTQQRIFDADRNFVRHCCDWMEDLRFAISTPAQSSFGTVGCLSGRTIALRREILLDALDDFLADSFLGIRCEIGDDRCLTNLTLRRGYRTVYQSDALVFTDCPNSWTRFAKQQLRWARSSQRETLKGLRWLIRRPFLAFCFISDILTPFLLAALVLVLGYHLVTGQAEMRILAGTPLENPIVMLAAAYAGAILSIGVRQIPHFRRYPRDVLLLPAFVLVLTFILVPVRIIGFLTMGEQNWITRLVQGQRRPHVPARARAVRILTCTAGIALLLGIFVFGVHLEQRVDPYAAYRGGIEQPQPTPVAEPGR
jgi:hyaluronan synthase